MVQQGFMEENEVEAWGFTINDYMIYDLRLGGLSRTYKI
jgi:hypothetical protein